MAEASVENANKWIFYIELASSFLVLAYTAFVLYDEYGSPGQAQYVAAKFCQRVAFVFGQWGLYAETKYHKILEAERMI